MQIEKGKQDRKGLFYAKGQSSQGAFNSYECTSNDTAVTHRAGPAGDARRNRNILILGHFTHHSQAKDRARGQKVNKEKRPTLTG